MNIYVFEDVKHLTENWHDEGGAVVIARNKEEAIGLLMDQNKNVDVTESVVSVYALSSAYEDVEHIKTFIFPNAGCC